MPNGVKNKLSFHLGIVAEPLAPSDLEAVERVLARLVAASFAADHQNLFAANESLVSGTALPSPTEDCLLDDHK